MASQSVDLVVGLTRGRPWASLVVKVGLRTSRLETRFKESSVVASVSGIGNKKPLERQVVLPLK